MQFKYTYAITSADDKKLKGSTKKQRFVISLELKHCKELNVLLNDRSTVILIIFINPFKGSYFCYYYT